MSTTTITAQIEQGTATMRAVRAHRRGGPEQLRVETVPVPRPGPGEVLLAVAAAAITYDELLWDETWTRDGQDRTPVIPSHEVAGTVVVLGPGVTGLAVGDEVFGLLRFEHDGAAAEYVVAPAADLAAAPLSCDPASAAALPLAGLTAWQALHDHALLVPGESVLVLGGAGGVGAYVVQLAHALGARVTATVRSAEDADYVSRLGADDVAVGTLPSGPFDVVVDTVGGSVLAAAYGSVRDGGRLVTLSEPPGAELRQGRDVRDVFFVVRPDRGQLERLAALVDDGRLFVQVREARPLDEAAAAYADRGRGARRPGKTVLSVAARP